MHAFLAKLLNRSFVFVPNSRATKCSAWISIKHTSKHKTKEHFPPLSGSYNSVYNCAFWFRNLRLVYMFDQPSTGNVVTMVTNICTQFGKYPMPVITVRFYSPLHWTYYFNHRNAYQWLSLLENVKIETGREALPSRLSACQYLQSHRLNYATVI